MWSHKSLAEYFCGQFIVSDAKSDQARICDFFAKSLELPSYRNILDLLYDMDYALFGQHFILPLISLYNAELKRFQGIFSDHPVADVESRAAVTFGIRPFLLSDDAAPMNVSVRQRINHISRVAMKEWYGIELRRKNKL